MIEQYLRLRRYHRLLLAAAVLWGIGFAIILIWPKNPQYASDQRFWMTVLFWGTALAGLTVTSVLLKKIRELRLELAYSAAPRSLVVAARFYADEVRASRAGIAKAAAGFLIFSGLHVLSLWPQAAFFASSRTAIDLIAGALAATAVAMPVWNRGHVVNSYFLRGCLRQIAEHLALKPISFRGARRVYRMLGQPAVKAVPGGVQMGGMVWHSQDFGKGAALLLGSPGSGKTSFVGAAMLEANFLLHPGPRGFGGVIFDVMGGAETQRVRELCAKYGRSEDLVIYSLKADPTKLGTADAPIFNPCDSDAPVIEIAAAIVGAMQRGGMRSPESYFMDATRDFIAKSLTVLRAGLPHGHRPSLDHIHRLAHEPPPKIPDANSREQAADEGFFAELSRRIVEGYPDPATLPPHILDAIDFFMTEWANIPDRQRGGITGNISTVTAELRSEAIRPFIAGPTTFRIKEFAAEGKILCVEIDLAEFPRGGQILCQLLKPAFQNEVRRKAERELSTPSVLYADEFHNIWTPETDTFFVSMSRQYNHKNYFIVQNLPLLQTKGTKEDVMGLLGNCTTQIFLRNSEPTTNEYASGLFGEVSTISVSQSETALFGTFFRRSKVNYSRNTSSTKVVSPDVFGTLAVPSRDRNINYTQAIVHLGTRADAVRGRMDLFWRAP